MDTYYASLTVWFEGPFWVGVLQREDGGRLTACRHVFGAEPKEQEVYQWLLRGIHYSMPRSHSNFPYYQVSSYYILARYPSSPSVIYHLFYIFY
jgi:hypothetical protein